MTRTHNILEFIAIHKNKWYDVIRMMMIMMI